VGGHHPNPFQVAPETSQIGCEGVSWPGVPPVPGACCMTFKDIVPGLSRTLTFNFQDFPGPK